VADRLHLANPARPDPAVVRRTAEELRAGRLVLAPSDTVYGFLGLMSHPGALEALAARKGRTTGFIALVATQDQVARLSPGDFPGRRDKLARVWPGPVTVVLPAASGTPGAREGGIALRMPRHPFLEAVLAEVGEPLFSTSANPPGESPARSADEVEEAYSVQSCLLIDGGSATGRPTTVVDLTQTEPRILRMGDIDPGPLLDPPSVTP